MNRKNIAFLITIIGLYYLTAHFLTDLPRHKDENIIISDELQETDKEAENRNHCINKANKVPDAFILKKITKKLYYILGNVRIKQMRRILEDFKKRYHCLSCRIDTEDIDDPASLNLLSWLKEQIQTKERLLEKAERKMVDRYLKPCTSSARLEHK